jgi:5'-methylthioadenosine phosphorylase
MSEPKIGIIGGSGLYQMPDIENPKWINVSTPFGKPSDSLLTGKIANRQVVFLPRHGRNHSLAPHELNHKANIFAFKKLGVAWIISISAVGSLQERFKPCDIVLPDQFVDHTKKSSEHTFFGNGIVAHVSMAHPVCHELKNIIYQVCQKLQLPVHDGGTYVNMEGPAFSTKAESLTNHNSGYSVIGMTNLGEARCAREAEIAYATVAMITDYDCWKDDESNVTVDMVIANLKKNITTAQKIILNAIPLIPHDLSCSCHKALENAIITPKTCWRPQVVKKLKPILKNYL